MTALKRFAIAALMCCSNLPPARESRRGVAVAEDDVVHAVRGRSVVLDRPAVRAAVERRRADDHAARARRAACRRCRRCRRRRRCRPVRPCRSFRRAPPRRRRCRRARPCRSCRRPAAGRAAAGAGASCRAGAGGAGRARRGPALPPRRRWCRAVPVLPAVPVVARRAARSGGAVEPAEPVAPAAPGPVLPPLPDGVVPPSLWAQAERRGGQPRARGMRNEVSGFMGICMSSAFTAHGRPKNAEAAEKTRQVTPGPDIHRRGESMSRLHQAGWYAFSPACCWPSLSSASRPRLRAGGGPPTGDVDQPSPIDWQSQSALMTAPSKSPRTIAAMMFDIGGGVPERRQHHERHRRHRAIAAPHVPGNLVRHPGHAARVLRSRTRCPCTTA